MLTFILAIVFFLIQIFTSKLSFILAFAPFIILLFRSTEELPCLWTAFLCGLAIDLLSSTPFGIFTLGYALTTFILYRQKNYLIDDKSITFFLFNSGFSLIFHSIHVSLLFMMGKSFPLSFSLIFVDILLYCFLDGVYALLWFYFPIKFIKTNPLKVFFRKKA